MKKHAIIPVFIAHRGCPNQCVFCNQKAITARDGNVTVEDAERTIEEWLTTLDINETEIELSYFGGSFTGIPVEEQIGFMKLAKEYKDAGRINRIHCSTRPDYISPEILDMLSFYGMDVIELGVQSFDPEVLNASRRGHSPDDVFKACELIKSYGFTLGIQLMIGLPGDSYESCMESVKQTIAVGPSIARLYPTVVLADTPLADMLEKGEYKPKGQEEMLKTVRDMYLELTAAGIKVIRIGLKSNELIKGETYHPAFGQLVMSSIARDEIERQLQAFPHKGIIEIAAPPNMVSNAAGHKGSNKAYFREKYPELKLRFVSDETLESISVRRCADGV